MNSLNQPRSRSDRLDNIIDYRAFFEEFAEAEVQDLTEAEIIALARAYRRDVEDCATFADIMAEVVDERVYRYMQKCDRVAVIIEIRNRYPHIYHDHIDAAEAQMDMEDTYDHLRRTI